MTKRDFYAKVIAAAIDEELTEFAKAEIEKLDKENAKRREKTAAKAAENQPLLDEIYDNILTYKCPARDSSWTGETILKKPLTMFCARKPAKDTFTWKGKEVPSVCWTPTSSRFKHKGNAQDNNFLNSEYDFSKQSQVQPKLSKYINPDYDKILDDQYAKSLYDSIFDIMRYCWDIYFPGQPYLGQMPQIEASAGAQLSRLFNNGLQATSQQLISNMTDVQAKDDVIRTKDRIVNPDGSYANEVLQKYVGKINDPQMISIDHFNAVAHFLMAAQILTLDLNILKNSAKKKDNLNQKIIKTL